MFIASGSAIWSILAPIFVPMFMLLGFHPAFAQILFRIADSSVLPLALEYLLLSHCFLDSCNATNQTRNWVLTIR
ncbi:AbgT family transporter [Escherichia coli]